MDAFFNEGFQLRQECGRQQHDTGRAIPDLDILTDTDIDQGLGGRMLNFQQSHQRGAVIANGDLAIAVGNQFVAAGRSQGRLDGIGDGLTGVDIRNQLRNALLIVFRKNE